MKKRKSKLNLSKNVISTLKTKIINGGRKPKSGYASCDSLLEQTIDFQNC